MFILDFRKDAGEFINKFVIGFVSGIYKLVDYAYRVFMVLAKTNIFSEENFKDITSNIYKILAVAMLFILAYAILLKIVDPDGSTKGIDGKKTFQNFIIAIILIILCPSIFSFAYGLQSAILDSGIIGGIITGNVGDASSENVTNANIYGGILMSVNTFEVFFRPVGGLSGSDVKGATNIGEVVASKPVLSLDGSSEDLYINCDGSQSEECSYDAAFLFAQNTGSFAPMKAFALNMYDNEIDFDWFAAFIVGLLLVYVIISFCFDMGIRVCKLAFFQMIAPIGIICMAIPKMEDVFKKWLSNTTKTYLSVFIRTLVMSFGVYLISLVANNPLFSDETGGQTGVPIFNLMAKCFLIMGIVVFIKQSPKLLGDIFGIGDGDMKLGIKDKLKAGGAFAAGAAIGAGTTGLVRNAVNAGQNFKKAPKDKKFGAVVKGIGSTLAGGASGLTKGLWYAKDAGSGKDMKNAASKAANKAVENRTKRENYTASHSRGKGWLDDRVQNVIGHVEDTGVKVAGWAGYKNLAQLKMENAAMDEITSAKDGFDSAVDAYISKAIQKGELSVSMGNLNGVSDVALNEIRRTMEELNKARISGVNVLEAETNYENAKKNARSQVENALLTSSKEWDEFVKSDAELASKLSSLRVSAVKVKGSIANNASLDALKQAGIVGADFGQDVAVKMYTEKLDANGELMRDASNNILYTDTSQIKTMNDNIKLHTGANNVEIATREQKKQEDNKK